MTRKDRDTYVLSTGREVRANHGLIGLSADVAKDLGYGADYAFAGFELSEGYDGPFDVDGWTTQELEELADFMIQEWQRFRAAICNAKDHDWSPWRDVFSDPFGIHGGTQFYKHRHCRRCLIDDTLGKR